MIDNIAGTILPGAKLDMPKACPKGEYQGWYESTMLNSAVAAALALQGRSPWMG